MRWLFGGRRGGGRPAPAPGITVDPLLRKAEIWEHATHLTDQLIRNGVISDAAVHPTTGRIIFEVPGLDESKRQQIAALFEKHCPKMAKFAIVPRTNKLQLEPLGDNQSHYTPFRVVIQGMH